MAFASKLLRLGLIMRAHAASASPIDVIIHQYNSNNAQLAAAGDPRQAHAGAGFDQDSASERRYAV
jgi:hypothetical protein